MIDISLTKLNSLPKVKRFSFKTLAPFPVKNSFSEETEFLFFNIGQFKNSSSMISSNRAFIIFLSKLFLLISELNSFFFENLIF